MEGIKWSLNWRCFINLRTRTFKCHSVAHGRKTIEHSIEMRMCDLRLKKACHINFNNAHYNVWLQHEQRFSEGTWYRGASRWDNQSYCSSERTVSHWANSSTSVVLRTACTFFPNVSFHHCLYSIHLHSIHLPDHGPLSLTRSPDLLQFLTAVLLPQQRAA